MGRSKVSRLGALALLAAISAVMVSACDSVSLTSVGVVRVDVRPGTVELVTGQSKALNALALDGGGGQVNSVAPTWSTSDPSVVQVDGTGMVTAVTPGIAVVTADIKGIVGTAAVTVDVAGQLTVSTDSLAFSAISGGGLPSARTVQVGLAGDGAAFDLATRIDYAQGSGWLTATLDSNKAPARMTVQPQTGSLANGTYRATIEVASPSASNGSVSVQVTLTVGNAVAVIGLTPDSVVFTAGGNRIIEVRNIGANALTGLSASIEYDTASASGWLAAGLGAPNAPTALVITANETSLPPGTHRARVRVSSSVANVQDAFVDVTLLGGTQAPRLEVSPDTVRIATTANGTATAVVQIRNVGSGSLSGLTRAVSYGSGQQGGWLQTSLSGTTAPADLSLVADASGLNQGTYNGSVEIGANAANAPQFVVVQLTVSAAPITSPAAPTGIAAAATSGTTVDVTWSDASGDETSFEVRRRVSGGTFAGIGSVGAGVTLFKDTGLSQGTTYDYQVRACNAAGCSNWAGNGTVTMPAPTPTVPAAPSGLTAIPTSSTAINLDWTDASTNETGFEIERRIPGPGSTFAPLATRGANVTDMSDTGLSASTSYEYRVRACNAAGCSSWSASASATTPAPPAAAPTAPTGVQAAVLSAIDVDVTWTDASSGETHFEIQRVSAGSTAVAGQAAANVQSFRDTNLAPGGTYDYAVRACASSTCSAWVSAASITTQNPTTVPLTPTRLNVTSSSPQAVTLVWNDRATDETYVQIEEGSVSTAWQVIGTVGVNQTSFTDTQVVTGQTIQYRVRACNPVGCSGSNFISLFVP